MNLRIKSIFTACMLFAVLFFAVGCAPEKTPYEVNDGDNYTLSVKFDANGGVFTTNTSVIVDSFDVSALPVGSDGNAELALISPDDANRGNDAFTAINNGYFLAGWYAKRTETLDSEGVKTYIYSDKWDFASDLLKVDPSKTYHSSEPVMTLYAAWIPMFEVAFYDLSTGEHMESYSFNPMVAGDIQVPQWNMETGAIEMYDFPEKSGYTFAGAYYDAEGKQPVEVQTLAHPGAVDETNGVAKDPVMKLYVDWQEGEWYHIYNVEQFLENADVSASYVLHADLDFTDAIWPTALMHGNYTGTIQGNGHVLRNITLEQTNNSKMNSGLFGSLSDSACITDLTLENVTFTVKAGTRMAGASFGLLAGSVSEGTKLEKLQILDSFLQIDSSCYFGTDDYSIGLVCGMGSTQLEDSGITCKAVGENPENITISVNEGEVTLEFAR